jgi:Protein of unknown function (DUF3710)
MALFKRRPAPEGAEDADLGVEVSSSSDGVDDVEGQEHGEDSPGGSPGSGYDRSSGPFDESESDLADPEVARLDLGSLLIPGLPGIGVQVEADPNTQEVRAVTGVGEGAAVQLQAFAAPRSEGLWDEIRAEMLAELAGTAGARVSEDEGAFGPEIRGLIPARTPEGEQVTQPVRFVGIDGPRWFLRAVFLGRAAVEPDPSDMLHRLVRQTIVVRGASAMAPRDPLPLTLPQQPATAEEGASEDVEGSEDSRDAPDDRFTDLDPFERGPEITEIR